MVLAVFVLLDTISMENRIGLESASSISVRADAATPVRLVLALIDSATVLALSPAATGNVAEPRAPSTGVGRQPPQWTIRLWLIAWPQPGEVPGGRAGGNGRRRGQGGRGALVQVALGDVGRHPASHHRALAEVAVLRSR